MRLARVFVSLAIGVALLEICLRIYNPLPIRVRGDRIVLPVRQTYTFTIAGASKLDSVVHHTKNSLGFRGPEPPRDWARRLTVLTIGGSTTECLFLSDGKTWTDQLARRLTAIRPDVWVNNAGMDGHSTFGHLILLRDFVASLHPTFAVFLIGTNDVERGGANGPDAALTPQGNGSGGVVRTALNFTANHLVLAAVAENAARALRARRAGFGHSQIDLRTAEQLHIDAPEIERILQDHRSKYLAGFGERVAAIIELCRRNGIEPVLVTQPALFGEAVDPATGIDLRMVKVSGRGNGVLEWRLLELYNDVTRESAARAHVQLIDLARQLPKDSRYFYDFLHFTNEGALRVGDLVFDGLAARIEAVPRTSTD